jgi:hypothetical protein
MESDEEDLEVIYESHLSSTTSSTTTTPNQRTGKKSFEKVGLFPKLDDDPAKVVIIAYFGHPYMTSCYFVEPLIKPVDLLNNNHLVYFCSDP